MCGTKEPMGAGVPVGTNRHFKNMSSGRFRVPGEFGQSGFWIPGEPFWPALGLDLI